MTMPSTVISIDQLEKELKGEGKLRLCNTTTIELDSSRQHQPFIRLHLYPEQLLDGSHWRDITRSDQVTLRVPVGFAPVFPIGSVFDRGHKLEDPTYETATFTNVRFSSRNYTPIRAHDYLPGQKGRYIIPPWVHPAKGEDRDARYLAIGQGKNPFAILIPTYEILRVYYARSMEMSTKLFTTKPGDWEQFYKIIYEEPTLEGEKHVIRMANKLTNEDTTLILMLALQTEPAVDQVKNMYVRSLSGNDQLSRELDLVPPFYGVTNLRACGRHIETKHHPGKCFLVYRLTGHGLVLPNNHNEYRVRQYADSSQGAVIAENPKEAFKGAPGRAGSRRNDEITLSSDSSPDPDILPVSVPITLSQIELHGGLQVKDLHLKKLRQEHVAHPTRKVLRTDGGPVSTDDAQQTGSGAARGVSDTEPGGPENGHENDADEKGKNENGVDLATQTLANFSSLCHALDQIEGVCCRGFTAEAQTTALESIPKSPLPALPRHLNWVCGSTNAEVLRNVMMAQLTIDEFVFLLIEVEPRNRVHYLTALFQPHSLFSPPDKTLTTDILNRIVLCEGRMAKLSIDKVERVLFRHLEDTPDKDRAGAIKARLIRIVRSFAETTVEERASSAGNHQEG